MTPEDRILKAIYGDKWKTEAEIEAEIDEAVSKVTDEEYKRVWGKSIDESVAEIMTRIKDIDEGKEPPIIENKITDNLNDFKPGDIIYSFENEDYFASVVKLPENFRGKDCFNCDMIVKKDGTWERCDDDCFDVCPGMKYRIANEEEVKMFNEAFG